MISEQSNLRIRIDRSHPEPIYRQISRQIEDAILAGQLPEGSRLPPERTLAQALGVNRTTVLAAYRSLKARDLLSGHVGRGTTVLPAQDEGRAAGLPWAELAREAGTAEPDPLIRDLLELTERRDVISLSLGMPARELLPLDTVRDVVARLLVEQGPDVLLHSPTEGLTALREALCEYLEGRGIRSAPQNVLVLAGSQQGLDLVTRAFLAPDDAVVVEEPSYVGALQVFRRARVKPLGVPVDGEGMRTDLLESLLQRRRPKLIYTLPTFQNPSGAVMSLPRRRHLLELSHRFQVPVLEDDPYGELRYEGEPLPPLKALDTRGQVLHLSSLSKVLFPGLRVGWLVAPPAVVRQLALVRQTLDLHTCTLSQWIAERFLRGGHFARHLSLVRPEYARRRDTLIEALAAEAPEGLTWTRPQGGFYVWCRLPRAVSSGRVLAEAARERVAVLPGAVCFPGEAEANFARLNFTCASTAAIREGAARFARAVRAVAAEPPVRPEETEGMRPIV
jgi:DNA-binding transcriptional MocR family regulator